MTGSPWAAVNGWAVPTAAAGLAVFALALALARVCRRPAERERAAVWAMRAGLLAAGLALLPAWVPVPGWRTPARTAAPNATAVKTYEIVPLDPELLERSARLAAGLRVADARAGRAELPDEVATDAAMLPADPVPTAAPPGPVSEAAMPSAPAAGWGWADWLTAAYLAGGLVLAGRAAAGHAGLARLTAAAAPAPDRVRALAAGLPGFRPGVRVKVTDRLPSPVCFGLFRPTVLLPRRLAESGTDEQLRWVLAHELDHLRRADPWAGLAADLAGCVFFPLPVYWAVRRELRLAQEQLADAAAATAGGGTTGYAAFLVGLAGGPNGGPNGRLPIRPARSDLYRRVTMLLETDGRAAGRVSRRWAAVTAGGLLGTGVLLSGLGPAGADEPDPPAPLTLHRLAGGPAEDAPAAPDEVRRLEEAIKGLQKTADGLADAPEAKAAIETAIAEYRKRIAELRAKAKADPPAPRRVDGVKVAPPGQQDRPRAAAGDPQQRMQDLLGRAADDVLRAYEQQLQATNDPAARKALEEAVAAYRAAMDGVRQQLRAGPGVRLMPLDGQNLFAPPAGVVNGKGRLGVVLGPVPDVLLAQFEELKDKGQMVAQLMPGSPAAKAGVRLHDVLLVVAGREVSPDPTELVRQVTGMKAGEPFDVVVLRGGKRQTLKGLVLAEVKADKPEPKAAAQADDGPAFSSVSVSVTDDEFTIKAERDGVRYAVEGAVKDGKPVPAKVTVRQGEKKAEYDGLAKLPAEHKAAVEALLKRVNAD